jgi:hypothetical protein
VEKQGQGAILLSDMLDQQQTRNANEQPSRFKEMNGRDE